MLGMDYIRIDITPMAPESNNKQFSLTHDYFKSLDQDDISDGNVFVKVCVHPQSEDYCRLDYKITGHVVVACDRCLDPVTYAIDVTDSVILYFGKGEPTNKDAHILSPTSNHYELSWDVYESIELSLPIRRIHKNKNECNPDMLRFINAEGN